MGSASFGYLGVGVETTHGTGVAPTKFVPVKSVDFDVQQDEIRFREIAGSRQAQQSFGGSIRPSVTFDTAFYPSGAFGVILRGLFGSVTSALRGPSTTLYDHTFGDASVLPSLSFERSDTATEGTGLLHERIAGCKIESVSFTAEFGAEVNMSVTAQGITFPTDPASKPGSITLPAMNPFIFTGVTVSIDGVDSDLFKSITFDFTNTLEPQEALRGTRTAYKIHEGPLECSLSGTMIYEDNSVRDLFESAEEISVAVTFEGDMADATNNMPYAAQFTWPKVKVLNFSTTMEAEGVMEADVEFSVSYDKSLSRFVQAKLSNLDPANAYNT
jgi:hypothetical protein